MRFRKLCPFILALLLLLLFSPLALAQPDYEVDPNAAAGAMLMIWGCVCAFILVVLAVNIAILVWLYKDAKARGADPMLWLILAFVAGPIALIIWLIVRPPMPTGGDYPPGPGYR